MRRKRRITSVLCFLYLLAFIFGAESDGSYFSARSAALSADQKAILIRSGNHISMTLSTGYTGDGSDFAWIIPTPVPPLVTGIREAGRSGTEAFSILDEMTSPKSETKSRGCFPAGTEVLTAAGPAAIESILTGTEVHAYDSGEGTWAMKKVVDTHVHQYSGDIVTLSIGDLISLDATGNHPFFVVSGIDLANRSTPADIPAEERRSGDGGRWVEAGDLRAGDRLLQRDGSRPMVTRVSSRTATVTVYNLEVEEFHTYTVHQRGFLVHNKAGGEKTGEPESLVTVHGQVELDHYEASILESLDGYALFTWLKEHGYEIKPEARMVLDGYIRDGWAFTALRLRPGEKRVYRNESLPPITIEYQHSKLLFPLRISSISTSRSVKLTLYVIAESTVRSRRFPTNDLVIQGWIDEPVAPEIALDMYIRGISGGEQPGLAVISQQAIDPSNPIMPHIDDLTSEQKLVEPYLTRLDARFYPEDMSEDVDLHLDIEPRHFQADSVEAEKWPTLNQDESEYSSTITNLMYAVLDADISDQLRPLIHDGADIDVRDYLGNSALMYAARFNPGPDTVAYLIENGADVNALNASGWTPVYFAARNPIPAVLTALVERGGALEQVDKNGWTPLIQMSRIGDSRAVSNLVIHGADVNRSAQSGSAALAEAAREGHMDIVRLLVDAGADIEGSTPNYSPLYLAAARHHPEVVELLLDAGAQVDQEYTSGSILQYLASSWSFSEKLWRLLIEAGAEIDRADNLGQTPLILAADKGMIHIVEMLIDAGADVNAIGRDYDWREYGTTALQRAADKGKTDVVRALVNAGADLEYGAESSYTALMLAAQRNNVEIGKILLEAGAHPDTRNGQGKTAFSIAQNESHTEFLEILRSAGSEMGSVETIRWETDFYSLRRFYTNDPANVREWFLYTVDESYQWPFEEAEVEVMRIAGWKNASFGMAFCALNLDNFYKLRITTRGKYKISKYVDGKQTTIVDWTYSPHLIVGYNVRNRLKVRKPSEGVFDVYFNDEYASSFKDDSLQGGYSGYYAWVSEDDIPTIGKPVDLRYRMLTPVNDPER